MFLFGRFKCNNGIDIDPLSNFSIRFIPIVLNVSVGFSTTVQVDNSTECKLHCICVFAETRWVSQCSKRYKNRSKPIILRDRSLLIRLWNAPIKKVLRWPTRQSVFIYKCGTSTNTTDSCLNKTTGRTVFAIIYRVRMSYRLYSNDVITYNNAKLVNARSCI